MSFLLFATVLFAAEPSSVLLCEDPESCPEDLVWARSVLGGAPIEGQDLLLDLDAGGWFGGVDQASAFAAALEAAQAAFWRTRWLVVESETLAAEEALRRWPGTVRTEALFRLWWLQAAARLARGIDHGHELSFRQAAAIANGLDIPLPTDESRFVHPWLEEARKAAATGTGEVVLVGVGVGGRWYVDGRPVGDGVDRVTLLAGTHRVTAVRRGQVRTWKAAVPVVPGRTSTVTAAFAAEDEAAYLAEAARNAFDSLSAPAPLTALLAEWCARNGLRELRLLLVEELAGPAARGSVVVGEASAVRPTAAAGEPVVTPEGVPVTFEEAVLSEPDLDTSNRRDRARRLRVVWFDPMARTFHRDRVAAAPLEGPDRRLRIGVVLGYARLLDHHHVAGDLALGWRLGDLHLEGRVGLVRADQPYNLYVDWQDRQLYHFYAGVRWMPDLPVAPYVSLGPEAYVPAALGVRGAAGVAIALSRRLDLDVEVSAAAHESGFGFGAGAGLAAAF